LPKLMLSQESKMSFCDAIKVGAKNAMRNKGFTLIEVLVVMVLLAIGLAIAIPNLKGMGLRNAAKAEVRELKNVLAKTRMDAVQRHESLTVTIDTVNNRCTVTDSGGATLSVINFNDVQLSASSNPLPIVWNSKGMTDNSYNIGIAGKETSYTLVVSAAGNIQIIRP
jgi:prepilin-type N-terminal cleavage/methylation domain-containing protein